MRSTPAGSRTLPIGGLFLAASLVLGGCGSSEAMNPDRCNVRIATISPVAPSVGRGTSLSLSASYLAALPCRPNVPASALHWLSSSPGVVTVDSITGVVTARSSGTAVLSVHAPGTIKVLAETQVMVP